MGLGVIFRGGSVHSSAYPTVDWPYGTRPCPCPKGRTLERLFSSLRHMPGVLLRDKMLCLYLTRRLMQPNPDPPLALARRRLHTAQSQLRDSRHKILTTFQAGRLIEPNGGIVNCGGQE